MAKIKEKNPTVAITTARSKFCKFSIDNSVYCQTLPCDKLGSKLPFASIHRSIWSYHKFLLSLLEKLRKIGKTIFHHDLLVFSAPNCRSCTFINCSLPNWPNKDLPWTNSYCFLGGFSAWRKSRVEKIDVYFRKTKHARLQDRPYFPVFCELISGHTLVPPSKAIAPQEVFVWYEFVKCLLFKSYRWNIQMA